jgi:hypothetical protein
MAERRKVHSLNLGLDNSSQIKIVVLDGYTENPGDLSWDAPAQLGEWTIYKNLICTVLIENIKQTFEMQF